MFVRSSRRSAEMYDTLAGNVRCVSKASSCTSASCPIYVGDLVDGHLRFDDQRRIFGHDVHQRFAWPHDAALEDLEPHHAAFHGATTEVAFGVLQGADTFTGLEDFVVQLAKLIGGFFNETVFASSMRRSNSAFFWRASAMDCFMRLGCPRDWPAFVRVPISVIFQIPFLVQLTLGLKFFVQCSDDRLFGLHLILIAEDLGVNLGNLRLSRERIRREPLGAR